MPKAWAEWEEVLIASIREPEPVDHLEPELARLAGCRKAQFTPAAQTILLTAGPTDASAKHRIGHGGQRVFLVGTYGVLRDVKFARAPLGSGA